jgi:serine protease AprX
VETNPLNRCPLCLAKSPSEQLKEASWLSPNVLHRLAEAHPNWRRADGACPACVQQALLQVLTEKGEAALHEGIQSVWPIDSEAAFGALPTPLRLHADPRHTGKGVTIAMIDSGFYPHADLVQPRNRIRAWVDAGGDSISAVSFRKDEVPRWPGWDASAPSQWHGLMTSVTAAGNGWLSHGLYRGLAPDANVVLIQARDGKGHITNDSITRALHWVRKHRSDFGIKIVSMSVAGDSVEPLAGNAIDEAIANLVTEGILVIAAAGNDGRRELVPPATAPLALTVGGLDDSNTFDHEARRIWHSNYGDASNGSFKPELVAPSMWVVAPLLPGTAIAAEAAELFSRRANGNFHVNEQIEEQKLVTPHYQHVEGTSFAAPVVAGIAACMIEANPNLSALRVRELQTAATCSVPGAARERQGAGAIEAGLAVALAMADRSGTANVKVSSPAIDRDAVVFRLLDPNAQSVRVLGSWDGWTIPGVPAIQIERGVWRASLPMPKPGRFAYKFLVNDDRWLTDPINPRRTADRRGGWNSVLFVNETTSPSGF